MLAEMERVLGTIQIRHWGTIGGDLCHADPGCDPAPPLIALGAKVKAKSLRGEREIPLDQFFVDYFETTLEPDEILTEIQVPNPLPHTGLAFLKESMVLGDCPIISVAAAVTMRKGVVEDVRIVLGAAGNTPLRAMEAEKVMMEKEVSEEMLREVGVVLTTEINPTTDAQGSADYKRELARVITK